MELLKVECNSDFAFGPEFAITKGKSYEVCGAVRKSGRRPPLFIIKKDDKSIKAIYLQNRFKDFEKCE